MALRESVASRTRDTYRQAILSFRGVTKGTGGTPAVNYVDLDLFSSEILTLLGENGAGTSILIKVPAGTTRPMLARCAAAVAL